jgi:predicted transcriptional regulator
MNKEIVDPHLTTKIVGSYVGHNAVGADQVSELITLVHRALGQLGSPAQLEEVRTPAVSVRRSVQREYVICLDCGHRAKTLRRHISTRHRLTRDDYLKRWGLRSDHPLTAPAYSEQRSTVAKALGLGRKATPKMRPAGTPNRSLSADAGPQSKPKPARRQSTRPASKSDGVDKAATENISTKRRSRSRAASAPAA